VDLINSVHLNGLVEASRVKITVSLAIDLFAGKKLRENLIRVICWRQRPSGIGAVIKVFSHRLPVLRRVPYKKCFLNNSSIDAGKLPLPAAQWYQP